MSDDHQATADSTRERIGRCARVEDCLLAAISHAKGLECEERLAAVLAAVLEEYGRALT